MKKLFIFFTFLSSLNASEVKNLDLKTTVELALKTSEDFKITAINIEKLENKYKEARSFALPKVEGSLDWGHYVKAPVLTADMPAPIGKIVTPIKQPWEVTASATLTQPIWTFGKVFSAMDMAESAKKAETHSHKAKKLEVEYKAKVLYKNALFAQKALEIAEESYKHSLRNKEILSKDFNYGRVSNYENVKMSADVAARIPIVMRAKNNLELAMKSLKSFLEIPEETQIKLTDTMTTKFPEYSEENLLRDMEYKEPNLKALENTIDVYSNLARLRKAEFYPSIGLFGSYQYAGNSNKVFVGGKDMYQMFIVGVALTTNLWDSGERRSIYKQALNEKSISELNYSKAKKNIKLQLESAISSYKTTLETYKANLEAVNLSKRSYEISQSSYNSGKITQTQLNDAEILYTQTRLGAEEILFSLNRLMAEIDMLTAEEYVL